MIKNRILDIGCSTDMDIGLNLTKMGYKENFEIRALKVMEDHVHLFVSIPPKFSVSETVQYFKGYSARKIFLEFPWLKQFEVGEKRFWGGNLWSRGYFFRSVGSRVFLGNAPKR